MPLDLAIACFMALCLVVFWGVNLVNLRRARTGKERSRAWAEVESPSGMFAMLAAFGTGTFFLESVMYVVFVFAGLYCEVEEALLPLRFPFDSSFRLLGLVVVALGYTIFIWSVLARGRYATSWKMPEDQKLVTWGPYRYIRHPSYLAYFILFTGQFFILLNLAASVPFVAILGYLRIADREEQLLVKRFGEAYLSYQRITGRFLPKKRVRT